MDFELIEQGGSRASNLLRISVVKLIKANTKQGREHNGLLHFTLPRRTKADVVVVFVWQVINQIYMQCFLVM